MDFDQVFLFALLVAVFGLFFWGRLRHDVVAFLALLAAVVAGALSPIMNNVGALALLMPAALRSVAKIRRSPAVILMPLSFGSILGGLVTLIGTPANIIVAAARGHATGTPFAMFDFTPVGGAVAVAGIVVVAVAVPMLLWVWPLRGLALTICQPCAPRITLPETAQRGCFRNNK